MAKRIIAVGYIRSPYPTLHMTIAPATPEELRLSYERIKFQGPPVLDDDDRRKIELESREDI